MPQYIQLPDGGYYKLKEGQSTLDALADAQERFPDAFKKKEAKPKEDTKGFKAAAAASLEELKGQAALTAGKLGLVSEDEAEAAYKARKKAAQERFTPTEEGWTESPWQKLKETAGGSVPYLLAPAAAAGIGALAATGVGAPAAAALTAGALGAAANYGQFVGTNLGRQVDEGKTLRDADFGAAAAAALPQAAIDTAAMALMPGVGKLFGSVGAKLTEAEIRAVATQTLRQSAADYAMKTGAALGREGLGEATQQVFERLQAGLSLTDEDARKEYIDNFIGGAALGAVGAPVGRAYERSKIKDEYADLQAADKKKADAALAAQRQQEEAAAEAEKGTPAYALKINDQMAALEQQKVDLEGQKRKIEKGSQTEAEDREFNRQIWYQLKENSDARKELAPEIVRLRQSGVLDQALQEREAQQQTEAEQKRVEGLSPLEYQMEQMGEVPNAPAPAAPAAQEDLSTEDNWMVAPDRATVLADQEREKQNAAAQAEAQQRPLDYMASQIEAMNLQLVTPPTAKDYVAYLTTEPLIASQIISQRLTIPGLSADKSDMIRSAMQRELKKNTPYEAPATTAMAESGAPVEAPKVPKARQNIQSVLDWTTQYLQDQEGLDFQRSEGQTESDIRMAEKAAAMPTSVTRQGELFGEPTRVDVAQTPSMNSRADATAKLAELQKELNVARAARNEDKTNRPQRSERVTEIIEQMRVLKDALAEPKRTDFGALTKGLTEVSGSALPTDLAAVQAEQQKRAAALGQLVKMNDAVTTGKGPDITPQRIDQARQAVVDTVVNEIKTVRPNLRPETITSIENEVSDVLDTGLKRGHDVTPVLDAIGQKWRAATQTNPSETVTTTPKNVAPETVVRQIHQLYTNREKDNRVVGLSDEDQGLVQRVIDNFGALKNNPQMLDNVSNWLYNRQYAPTKTEPRDVAQLNQDLRTLEEGKMSEEPGAPRQMELTAEYMPEAVAPQTESRIENGRVSFVSPTDVGPQQEAGAQVYAPAQKGTVFESYEELNEYLSSDYLQAARQQMGLTKDTVARMERDIAEFQKQVADLNAQIEALKTQREGVAQEGEAGVRAALSRMGDAEVKLSALTEELAGQIAPLRMQYENAKAQFEDAALASENISRDIANNITKFERTDAASAQAAQETLKAKEALRAARNKLGSLAEKLPGIRAAQQKVMEALQRQRNPMLFDLRDRLAEVQRLAELAANNRLDLNQLRTHLDLLRKNPDAKPSAIREVQEQINAFEPTPYAQAQQYARRIAELQGQIREAEANPYVPSRGLLNFINEDLRLQMQLQEEERKMDNAARTLMRSAIDIEKAEEAQGMDTGVQEQVAALEKDIASAKTAVGAARTAAQEKTAPIDKEIEGLRGERRVAERAIEQKQRDIEEAGKGDYAARLAAIKIEPISAQERADIQARDKKTLEEFQARTARLNAIPGEAISFEKQREYKDLLDGSVKKSDEIEAQLRENSAGIEELQVQVGIAEDAIADTTDPAKRAELAQRIKMLNERIGVLTASRDQNLKALDNMRKAEIAAEAKLRDNPEVAADIDKRIDKLVKSVQKQQDLVDEEVSPETGKPIPKDTMKDRRKALSRSKRELQIRMAQRSNILGVTRTNVQTNEKVAGEKVKRASGETAIQIDEGIEREALIKKANTRLKSLETQLANAKAAKNKTAQTRLEALINAKKAEIDELRIPALGKVSQATRVQSAAPGKFRAGTEETKKETGSVKQPIVEKRELKGPTAKKAVADANKFAAQLAAAKTQEERDAITAKLALDARQQMVDAAYINVEQIKRSIAALQAEREGLAKSTTAKTADRLKAIDEQLNGAGKGDDRLSAGLIGQLKMAEANLQRVQDEVNRVNEMEADKAFEALGQEIEKKAPPSRMASIFEDEEDSGLDFDVDTDTGIRFRRTEGNTGKYSREQVDGLVKRIMARWANAPVVKVVQSEADLPVRIRNLISRDNMTGKVPGLYDSKSKAVFVIADNVASPNDVILTVAHEATGHYGLQTVLGDAYKSTMDSIYEGNDVVRRRADAILKQYKTYSKQQAVEEVLAEMAENPTNAETRSLLRRVYEQIRKFLRNVAKLGDTFTDAEVRQLVANARKYVIEGGKEGAGLAQTEGASYRGRAAEETPKAMASLIGKVVSQPKTFREKLGSNIGLELQMQTADMRAAIWAALDAGKDALGDRSNFTQAMYNVLKADKKTDMVNATMSMGPLKMEKDAKGLLSVVSSGQNSAVDVFKAIGDLPLDSKDKAAVAQVYMVAQRAANKGLSKLDLGELGVTEQELADVMAAADANPALKKGLEDVRRKYNAYNDGLIDFNVEAGAISRAEGARLKKDGDYVPFYRISDNGTASLVFGGRNIITIGDIRRQPYLHELKGGNTRLLPLDEAIARNTFLLTDTALTNLSTRGVAYALQDIGRTSTVVGDDGKAKPKMVIRKGKGPDAPDVIRFTQEPDKNDPNDNGDRYLRIDTEGTVAEGVPSELLVKSVEGAHLPLPGFLKLAGAASDLLRSGVTRMPMYPLRQLFRDPMAAAFTGGLNYGPLRAVAKAGKDFVKMSAGNTEAEAKLLSRGLMQSQIFDGSTEDVVKMAKMLVDKRDKASYKKVFDALDRAAIRADATTRLQVFENAKANGLSDVEAEIAAIESMNFSKRGLSPTVQYATRLIPFLNSQIQSLNVLYRAVSGKMPFEEQQKIKRKFFNNAAMLVGLGLVYAMAMQDDDYYKNARPRDRYTNFFMHTPFTDEPIKLPIPYEAGYFFSLAVAAVDGMVGEVRSKEQLTALKDIFLQSVPGYSSAFTPQIVKPAFEVWTNKNFLTGAPIESLRMQNLDPTQRYNASTTEFAKQLSKVLPGLSPVQIEHIAKGYLGALPIAIAGAADGLFDGGQGGERAERRMSEMPFVGSMFQRKYGGADTDAVASMVGDSIQAKTTLSTLLKEGNREEAKAFKESHRVELATASAAGQYRQLVGRINSEMRLVNNRENMTAAEKRARLDKLEEAKQAAADRYLAMVKRLEENE